MPSKKRKETPPATQFTMQNCHIQSPSAGFSKETADAISAIANAICVNAAAAQELARAVQRQQPQNWTGVYISQRPEEPQL